jgi:hypothetical protein
VTARASDAERSTEGSTDLFWMRAMSHENEGRSASQVITEYTQRGSPQVKIAGVF